LTPACLLEPTVTAEVSLIVKSLARLKIEFAVRGGGHTFNAGAANIDSGITVSLRSMNQVVVDDEKSLVHIGGGAKWAEVYPILDAVKLATSRGRVSVGGCRTIINWRFVHTNTVYITC